MFSDQIGTPNMRIRHMQGNVGHSRSLTYFKAQNPNTWNHWHIELSHFEGFQVGKGARLRPEEERYQVRGEKKTYELKYSMEDEGDPYGRFYANSLSFYFMYKFVSQGMLGE